MLISTFAGDAATGQDLGTAADDGTVAGNAGAGDELHRAGAAHQGIDCQAQGRDGLAATGADRDATGQSERAGHVLEAAVPDGGRAVGATCKDGDDAAADDGVAEDEALGGRRAAALDQVGDARAAYENNLQAAADHRTAGHAHDFLQATGRNQAAAIDAVANTSCSPPSRMTPLTAMPLTC